MMPTTQTWKSTIAKLWSMVKEPSVVAWRPLFALFICALLAYGGAFAWHMLTRFDIVNMVRDANVDDSFYYFQIAYNLSQGKFSTFDGGVTQTNGYHPVWLLLITPFYWIFDKETALFGIKAFEIMLVAGGVALIASAAQVARLAWLPLFAALPMLYHNPIELLLGLEAAAAMFALALLILAVCLYMRHPQRWKWHIAALAFALPWVRIEYIAISLAVTAALYAIEWSRQERRSLRLSALANIRHANIPLLGAIAGMLIYFAYNRLAFGGILPISAVIKREWPPNQWANLVQNFWDTLQFDVFDYELLIAFEVCAYLLLAWRLALRSNDRRDWLLLAFLVGMFGLAAGHIAKFAQTVLASSPLFSYQMWYFVPAYLMTALIIPIRLYVAIHLIRRFIAPRRSVAANALSVGVVVIGASVLLAMAGFAAPFKWVDGKSRQLYLDWEISSYMGSQVMNRALPEGSVIGSWDAGVIGYFSRFPVVNLDGLVNSYDYFHARHTRRTEGLNFYRRYGITHFANYRYYPRNYITYRNVIFEGASPDAWDSQSQFRIWTYDPPLDKDKIDYSHWVWDDLKPHFDRLSDSVGVMFAGRTAQAFIKDCAQDEILVLTWQERKHDRSVRLEISPYRSRTGMCVDVRVLPRGARQSAQVKLTTPSNAYSANLPDSLEPIIRYEEPIIRSDFDAHIAGRSLIYTKSQCGREDVSARFFASVFPIDANNLPARVRDNGYYIIDFAFDEYGAIDEDGMCWAEVALPGYPIAEIHTGQYVVGEDGYDYVWEGNAYSLGLGMDADFENLADREPIIRSDFDVYIIGDSLIYAKAQCGEGDIEANFFASAFPLYSDDMSARVGEDGYEALDFEFGRYGAIADGGCWTKAALPDYPIAKIHTGQYVVVEDGYDYPWEGVYHFDR